MQHCSTLTLSGLLAAGLLLAAAEPSHAQRVATQAQSGASYEARLAAYTRARNAYEAEASAYWDQISEKRRTRFAKRRNNQPVGLDDYVLTQPPVYTGPPKPPGPDVPDVTKPPRAPIPVVADFLKAAADHYRFVPQRPGSDLDFKRAYAKEAKAAGLTRDQIVRIYAFETGGNGTYDVQSGLTHPRPNARAISTAVGYNQLLTTNSVSLLAGYGDQFLRALQPTGTFADETRSRISAHDRVQQHGAEPVGRARQAREDARRHGHSCGGARPRLRSAVAGSEAPELGQVCADQRTLMRG